MNKMLITEKQLLRILDIIHREKVQMQFICETPPTTSYHPDCEEGDDEVRVNHELI